MKSYIHADTHELMQNVFKYDDIDTLVNMSKKNYEIDIFEYIYMHINCNQMYLWSNDLDHNQVSMVKALTNEKYNILNFMIGLKSHKFSSIDFSKIIVFSDTDKSGQFIEKMIPYKYKYKCEISNFDRDKASHMSTEPRSASDNIVKYYCMNNKSHPYDIQFLRGADEAPHYTLDYTAISIMKYAKQYKYDITFKKNTKDEIKNLKWNNRKHIMLLSYGTQCSSLQSLSDDLIKQIILFMQ